MQIVLFTFIIIFSLSLVAYSRWDAYLKSSLFKVEQDRTRMVLDEEYSHKRNLAKLKSSSSAKKEEKKAKAISKLNLFPIFALDLAANKENERAALLKVLERLLLEIYAGAAFFDFVEDEVAVAGKIIEALKVAAKNPICQHGLRYPKDLAKLDLQEPILNELWYKMVKGVHEPEKNRIYPSILEEVTYLKQTTSVNLYLANVHLLRAIYPNEATVEFLITRRNEIKRELRNELISVEDAERALKDLFIGENLTDVPLSLLSFHIAQRKKKHIEERVQ